MKSENSAMNICGALGLLEKKNEFEFAWLYGENFHLHEHAIKNERTTFLFFYKIITHFLKLIKLIKLQKKANLETDVVFFAASKNQADSLISIHNDLVGGELKSKFIVTNKKLSKLMGNSRKVQLLNLTISDFINISVTSILRFPYLFYYLFRNGLLNRKILANFDVYLLCHTYIFLFYRVFLACKPKIIVLSNDHNSENRVLAYLAKKHEIKVCYVQHASVSPIFPPLNQFDYAFLDGLNSYDVYKKVSPGIGECSVRLTGIQNKSAIKLNSASQRKVVVQNIGVSISLLDSFERVETLIESMSDYKILIRLHPQQDQLFKRKLNGLLTRKVNVSLDSSESQHEYFSCLDVHLAGESGIHLEALLFGLCSYHVEFEKDKENYDYYGFLKSGLITTFEKSVLKGNCNLTAKQIESIKTFSATYRTKWESIEHQLVAKYLLLILKNGRLESNENNSFTL